MKNFSEIFTCPEVHFRVYNYILQILKDNSCQNTFIERGGIIYEYKRSCTANRYFY